MWKKFLSAAFVIFAAQLTFVSTLSAQNRSDEPKPTHFAVTPATVAVPFGISVRAGARSAWAVADAAGIPSPRAEWERLVNRSARGPGRYSLSFGDRPDRPQDELADWFYADVQGAETFTFELPPGPGWGQPYEHDPASGSQQALRSLLSASSYPAPYDAYQVPVTVYDPTSYNFGGSTVLAGGLPSAMTVGNWYDVTVADPATQGTPIPPDYVRELDLNLEKALIDIATTKVWGYRDGSGFVLDPNGNPMAHTTVGTLWLVRDNVIYQFEHTAATLEAMSGENMGREDRLNIATMMYGQAQTVNSAYVQMNQAWDAVAESYEVRNQFMPGDKRGQYQLSPNVLMRADRRYHHDQAVLEIYKERGNTEMVEFYTNALAENPYPAFLEAQSHFFGLMGQYPLLGIKRDTYWPGDEAFFFEELAGLSYGPSIDTFDERQGLLTVFDEFRNVGIETFTGFANEARTHIHINDLMPYGGPQYAGIHGGLATNAQTMGSNFVAGLMDDIAGSYGQYKTVEFADDMAWNIGIASGVALGSALLPGGQYIALAYAAADVSKEGYDLIEVTLETGEMEKMAVVTGFETLAGVRGGWRSEEVQAWSSLGMAFLFGLADAYVVANPGRTAQPGLRQIVDGTFDAARRTASGGSGATFRLAGTTRGILDAEIAHWRAVSPGNVDLEVERLTSMVTRASENGVSDDVIGGILTNARSSPTLTTTALDEMEHSLLVGWANANNVTVVLPEIRAGAVRADETPQTMLWLDFTAGLEANSQRILNLVTVGDIKVKINSGQPLTEAELAFIRTEIVPHGNDVLNWYEFTGRMVDTPQGNRLAGGFEQMFDERQLLWMRQQAGGVDAGQFGTVRLRPEDINPWTYSGSGSPSTSWFDDPLFIGGVNRPNPHAGNIIRDVTGNYLPLLSLDEYTALVARQAAGETIDVGSIARPGIANVADDGTVAVIQGAGRWEKTRPGDFLDVFIRSDAKLPEGAVIVQTDVSPDLVRQANLLSSRGQAGTNPVIVNFAVDNVSSFNRVRIRAGDVIAPTAGVSRDIREITERLIQQGEDAALLNQATDGMSPVEALEFLQRVETAGGLSNIPGMTNFGLSGSTIQDGTLPYAPGEIIPAMPHNWQRVADLEQQEFNALANQQLQLQIGLSTAAGVPDERIAFILGSYADPVRQAQELALTRLWYDGFQLQPTIPLGQPLTPFAQEAQDLAGIYVRFRDGVRNLPADQPATITNTDDFNWLRDQVWADPYYFGFTSRRGFYNLDNDPLFTPMLNPGAAAELEAAFWNTLRQGGGPSTPQRGALGGPLGLGGGAAFGGGTFLLSGEDAGNAEFYFAPLIDHTQNPEAMSFVMPGEDPGAPLAATITSTGNSTGNSAFEMNIVNSGKSVRVRGEGVVLEPIGNGQQGLLDGYDPAVLVLASSSLRGIVTESLRVEAVEGVSPVANSVTTPLTIGGYCLEKDVRPPNEGEYYRIAGATVQQQYDPQRRVLAASRRLLGRDAFVPDTPSDPEGYFHSIRQWAVWTIEQDFDEQSFTDAFVDHAKKNFEQAGQAWSDEIEKAIRSMTPGRWRAVQEVVMEAEKTAG